ncbi:hypothetical protein HIM_01043 [Hirsutella minnesotensis 3608]|nr:hypothetical protein HIM_01043 [Hirsutella minnesotensis 3608]
MEPIGGAKPARRSAANVQKSSKTTDSGGLTVNSKKESLDEQRFKLKMREAMKNPNWRDRKVSSSSSGIDLNSADSSDLDIASSWTQAPATAHVRAEPGVETGHTERLDISKLPPHLSRRYYAVSKSSSDELGPSHDSLVSNALYEVVNRKGLETSPSTHRTPIVFDIKPLEVGCAPKTSKPLNHHLELARIQRLSAMQMQVSKQGSKPSHSERMELIKSIYRQVSEDASMASTASTKLSHTTEQDTNRVKESSQEHSKDERSSEAAREEERKVSLGAKHAAFQKLLEKLRKSAPPREPSEEMKEIGCARFSASTTAPEWRRGCTQSRDRPSRGTPALQPQRARREKTASDFEVTYQPDFHHSERSDISGSTDVESDLNPKAREFCSFKRDSLDAGDEQGFPAPLTSVAAPKLGVEEKLKQTETDQDFQRAPAAASAPFPLPFCIVSQQGAVNGPPLSDLQLTPLAPWMGIGHNQLGISHMAAANLLRPISHYNMDQVMPGFIGGLGGQPASMAPFPVSVSTAPGFHSLPARLHPPAPLQIPILPPSTVPMAPPPMPLPVAKPKVPNAGDQQAYEAYIEQRKAMDPGYAMECRLRQQRRARRGLNRATAQTTS